MAVPTFPTVATTAAGSNLSADNVTCTAPASIAIGDLLFAHVQGTAGAINTPSGWTQIAQKTAPICAVFYRTADAGDVAASSYMFTATSNAGNMSASMARVTNPKASSPVTQSNSAQGIGTTVTVSTVTPSNANSLLLFFLSTATSGITFSAEAVATSNPSWTEKYDAAGTTGISQTLAIANRPESTATGNWTATASSSATWGGIVVIVAPIPDATHTVAAALSMAMSQYASTITTNSNVPVAAVPLSGVVPAPVIGHQEYPAFTNPDKSAPSWTNTPKTS